jgi:type II secretory pathway component PulF
MPEYSYIARNPRGEQVEGTIIADNSALAAGKVQSLGLILEKVRATSEGTLHERSIKETQEKTNSTATHNAFMESIIYPVASGVSLKTLALFYRQFATLIAAGLPLYQALGNIRSQTTNKHLSSAIDEMQRMVESGGKISYVMARNGSIFSEMQVEMIRAAEHGGMLEVMLKRIADYLEQELSFRQLVSRLTLYPKLVALCAILILGRSGITGGSMPAISSLVLSGNAAAYLMNTFLFLGEIFLIVLIIAAIFRLTLFKSEASREIYERVKYMLPGIGDVAKKLALARFGRAFGAMYSAGVPINTAVRVAGTASGSRLISRASERGALAAENGLTLSGTFRETGAFDRVVLDMLQTGEQTGNIDQMMAKVAEYLEGEAETKAYRNAHIFSVLMFLIVAVMIAMSIIGFWGAYGRSVSGAE